MFPFCSSDLLRRGQAARLSPDLGLGAGHEPRDVGVVLQKDDGGGQSGCPGCRQVSLSAGFNSRHLAVVGLGLMGGSLARALRPFAQTITGVDPNPVSREYALVNGVVDAATDDFARQRHV